MAWFKKTKDQRKKVSVPEGVWIKCDSCKEIIYKKEIERNLKICPKCNYHFRINVADRIKLLADSNSFSETNASLASTDPLKFTDKMSYTDRLKMYSEKSGISEAAVSGTAQISGIRCALVIMDFSFMGGSMGSVVGEKIVRSAELALNENIPLVIVSSSGGARMQEGLFSLMQMARVSAAIGRLKDAGVPYISIVADPTFGGVTASFVMLGDVIIAEPLSLIGFAGARVIETTIKQQLPEDFQRAEFLLEHGLIDMVVDRKEMKDVLTKLLKHMISPAGTVQEKA